jgi:hypothetical protein
MFPNPRGSTLGAACLAAALLLSAPARAEIQDYEFRIVDESVRTGDQQIAVELLNRRTKKLVPDAVIFAKRLDMAPDGMAEMVTKITEVPSPQPGVYRFNADFSMEGNWQLSLAAKVQGETGTVSNKLNLKAGK